MSIQSIHSVPQVAPVAFSNNQTFTESNSSANSLVSVINATSTRATSSVSLATKKVLLLTALVANFGRADAYHEAYGHHLASQNDSGAGVIILYVFIAFIIAKLFHQCAQEVVRLERKQQRYQLQLRNPNIQDPRLYY